MGRLLLVLGLSLELTVCQKKDPEAASCAPYVAPVPADTYVFPVLPGTPAWAAFTTGQQMVDACQVPAATLPRMSTSGLIATCLSYPLLSNMMASTSLQRGVRTQLANFNGFGELRQRPQAAVLLMERYQLMRPACLPAAGAVERGNYSFSFTYLEMILAQEEYLAQLSSTERRQLLQEALAKYADKQASGPDSYSIFGRKTTVFLMARLLQAAQYAPFVGAVSTDPDLQRFVSDVELGNKPELLDTVVEYAKRFK